VGVRTRVLASVLVMSALGLAVAGGVANIIQTRRTSDAIDASLAQEVEEFRTLAAQGIDPDTGARFATVEQLLFVALQRNVPSPNEMLMTFRGGQPDRYSSGGLPQLVNSQTIREAVTAVPAGSEVVVTREVDTAIGRVRLSIVPVGIEGREVSGAYVIAFAVDRELAKQRDLMRIYALVALGSLVLIGVVGWVVAGRLLRPLRMLSETTQRIGESDLTERVAVTGTDDVSDLTRTVNAMLDRLETAFETQRKFIDDAGHELKTPVTILRGHLELLDPNDPVEVAQTRALLLDELDRMGRLVEDLILLAKAERADFVQKQPVQLAGLVDGVLGKARGLGAREWNVEARTDATVAADPQRLTQALLQLADNAVKYSQPGTRVWLGSAVRGDEAQIWVRDEGPGIHEGDVGRVFERFGRAHAGRGVEGSGLGLAIVRAIAEAHRGRVEAHNNPGGGLTVTLVLPATVPPRAAPSAPDQFPVEAR
jgi:signal transduction histidine kinase